MSELQKIKATLEQTAARRRLERGLRGGWQGFLAGLTLWLAVLVCYKLTPIPESYVRLAGTLAWGIAAAGFLIAWWRPISLLEAARWVDRKKHLEERLSTALEV